MENKLYLVKTKLTIILSIMHTIFLDKIKTSSRPYRINRIFLAKHNYLSFNNKKSNTTLINIINSSYKP